MIADHLFFALLAASLLASTGVAAWIEPVIDAFGRNSLPRRAANAAAPTTEWTSDPLVERHRRERDDADRAATERLANATEVGNWCRDTCRARDRVRMPKLRREIAEWLPGLSAAEVIALARAHPYDIQEHAFGEYRIAGVRAVQRLEPSTLEWPQPRYVRVAPNDVRRVEEFE